MAVVQLFVTCLIDTLFPDVGESVVRSLRRAGADVLFGPEQTCCGQPAFNVGYRPEALQMAQRTIEVLEALPGDVVIPSGSCAAMIRHGYPELFAEEAGWLERSRSLAGRVWEFSHYLVDRLGFLPSVRPGGERIAYHASCHLLRGLGVDRQPRRLLEGLGGELVVLDNDCCGFGGAFSVDQPDLSGAMLDRRLNQIHESGATTVVTADVGCLMQLEGALRRSGSAVRCRHLAQVLDERGGGPDG